MKDLDSRVLLGQEGLGRKGRSMGQLDLRNSEFFHSNLIAKTLTGIGVVEDGRQHLSSAFPCLNEGIQSFIH
jgi:hypothetical protein